MGQLQLQAAILTIEAVKFIVAVTKFNSHTYSFHHQSLESITEWLPSSVSLNSIAGAYNTCFLNTGCGMINWFTFNRVGAKESCVIIIEKIVSIG